MRTCRLTVVWTAAAMIWTGCGQPTPAAGPAESAPVPANLPPPPMRIQARESNAPEAGIPAASAPAPASHPLPPIRIQAKEFNASEADIRAVCASAASQLWAHVGEAKVEPLLIVRGHQGPIALFQRNRQGEIVIRLDTGNTYWCQYAYQFAHEFCHVLTGLRPVDRRYMWLDESLCETASIFAIRAMARQWADKPPYPNWRDFRDSLRSYADDVIAKHAKVYEVYEKGLPGYIRSHQAELEKDPCNRSLNGAIAVVLLRLLEDEPASWESIRYLHAKPPAVGAPFVEYLRNWRQAVPDRHKAFVDRLARLLGQELDEPSSR